MKIINMCKIVFIAMVAMFIVMPAHAKCLVIGDSIAVGVGKLLPQCYTVAKVGRTTRQIIHVAPTNSYDAVIISSGTNDLNSASLKELQTLRNIIHAKQVMWIIPVERFKAAGIVKTLAQQYEDKTLSFNEMVSSDHTHPSIGGYHIIADRVTKEFKL